MNKEILKCQPAYIYLLIAVGVTIFFSLFYLFFGNQNSLQERREFNIVGLISGIILQIFLIFFVLVIILGLCVLNVNLAWASVIVLIICYFCSIFGAIINPVPIPY